MKFVLIGFLVLFSCGEETDPVIDPKIPEQIAPVDGFDDDPLTDVLSFRQGFDTSDRITAYVEGRKRVSMILTSDLSEAWGRSLAQSYSRSFHIPGLDGVFLVNESEFRLVTETKELSFPRVQSFDQKFRYARALEKPVYVESSVDDGFLSLVFQKEDGDFTDQEIRFESGSYLSESFAPLISDDGTEILIVDQNAGGYLRFIRQKDEFVEVDSFCPGSEDSEAVMSNEDGQTVALLTAAAWVGGYWAFGSVDGQVHFLKSGEECVRLFDEWKAVEIDLKTAIPIKRIQNNFDATLTIVHGDDKAEIFRAKNEGWSKEESLLSGCREGTIASHLISEKQFLSLCLNKEDSFSVQQYAIDFVSYNFVDKSIDSTITVDQSSTSQVSIDRDKSLLYLIRNDGFGKIEVHNFLDGSKRSSNGFVIEGILDRL